MMVAGTQRMLRTTTETPCSASSVALRTAVAAVPWYIVVAVAAVAAAVAAAAGLMALASVVRMTLAEVGCRVGSSAAVLPW